MPIAKTDPRVDAYIGKAAPFAQPILARVRKVIHAACPDVEETIKWGMPFFDYKGVICGTPAFKRNVRVVLWKRPLLRADKSLPGVAAVLEQLNHLESVEDLPSDAALSRIFKAAARLNDAGVKVARADKRRKPPVKVPAYFKAALAKRPAARERFSAFSPSHKREYVEWITEAKTAETRARRLEKAVEQIAEGKGRHWKYQPAAAKARRA